MNLVATKLHGYRPEGQSFDVDDALGQILVRDGKAKLFTQKPQQNEKVDIIPDAGSKPVGKPVRKRTK